MYLVFKGFIFLKSPLIIIAINEFFAKLINFSFLFFIAILIHEIIM